MKGMSNKLKKFGHDLRNGALILTAAGMMTAASCKKPINNGGGGNPVDTTNHENPIVKPAVPSADSIMKAVWAGFEISIRHKHTTLEEVAACQDSLIKATNSGYEKGIKTGRKGRIAIVAAKLDDSEYYNSFNLRTAVSNVGDICPSGVDINTESTDYEVAAFIDVNMDCK